MMSRQTFLRAHVFPLTDVYSAMRAHVLHEEGEGEDGRGRLIPSNYNYAAYQAACCISIEETDAGESAACISIEGLSGGSHDVTPLLDGDAADADPDDVAHGAT